MAKDTYPPPRIDGTLECWPVKDHCQTMAARKQHLRSIQFKDWIISSGSSSEIYIYIYKHCATLLNIFDMFYILPGNMSCEHWNFSGLLLSWQINKLAPGKIEQVNKNSKLKLEAS